MFYATSLAVLCLTSFAYATVVDDLSCDFQSRTGDSICNYRAGPENSLLSWSISNGITSHNRKLNGPLQGVENSGNFLQLNLRIGYLISPKFSPEGKYCFSVDYYQFGIYFSSLYIYAQREGKDLKRFNPDYVLFVRNANSLAIDKWQKYEKTIEFLEGNYTIAIRAIADATGTIALDNLKFETGPCAPQPDEEQVCDFDAILGGADNGIGCDWLEIDNTNVTGLNNKLKVGNAELRGDEVIFDHSSRDAYGGRLRSIFSDGARPKINFGIFTPEDGRKCLSFAYFGIPPHFNVIETSVATGHQNVLFTIHANQRYRYWYVKRVQIDPVVPIRVSLNILGGTISFDSFELTSGDCPELATCDFTQDTVCGFQQESTCKGQWYLGNGRLQNPKRNYTVNAVEYPFNFYYADMTPNTVLRSDRRRAAISSEHIDEGGEYCFRMTYNMNYLGDVAVFVNTQDGDNMRPVMELERDGDWIDKRVNVKTTGPFVIIIVVTRYIPDFMLQEFQIFRLMKTSLKHGRCATVVKEQQFGEANFHCYQTGHVIPRYRTCDGVIDCPMGEDEGENCSGGHECTLGGIPCSRRGHKFCLENPDNFCNGEKYCDDAIDEDPRMCSSDSFCENFCLHGSCDANMFTCECEKGYYGKRCSFEG